MKADYKNWMPGGMVVSSLVTAFVLFILTILFGFGNIVAGTAGTVLKVVLCIATIIAAAVFIWMFSLYRAFSYNGKRQMSKQIIEGIAERLEMPIGGKCLDVGCGSGALTIACAKRNPYASFTGIDRWGKEYASFSQSLCENNAKAEGVRNVTFEKGDATSLAFPDESFDAITSNYVYHNIPSRDRQEILLESLRVLKKGGSFAIHDIFSKMKYGDMQSFVQRLKDMGYEKVELIDTTDGMFMSSSEAKWLGLSGSALLVGRK